MRVNMMDGMDKLHHRELMNTSILDTKGRKEILNVRHPFYNLIFDSTGLIARQSYVLEDMRINMMES